MKKIFGKNQVIITALAVMIAVAGYLSVTQDKSNEVANFGENQTDDGTDDASKLDEASTDGTLFDISDEDIAQIEGGYQLSDNGDIVTGDTDNSVTDIAQSDASKEDNTAAPDNSGAPQDSEAGVNSAGEAVLVSSTIGAEYFDAAKLSREQTRSKNKEILMELVNSATTTDAQKEKAVGEVIELTSNLEKETAAENMLEAKGFGDCIVNIVEGKVDVIVNANNLTEKQIAQIEDVVKRKTDVTAENIVITPVGVTQ
ncbi:MAG: SpoIIIAH-like family protein [Lachnospiraceae bacterium]|nr:SpoIIIAH-like family protein [Lachnospiraceae bacterium]